MRLSAAQETRKQVFIGNATKDEVTGCLQKLGLKGSTKKDRDYDYSLWQMERGKGRSWKVAFKKSEHAQSAVDGIPNDWRADWFGHRVKPSKEAQMSPWMLRSPEAAGVNALSHVEQPAPATAFPQGFMPCCYCDGSGMLPLPHVAYQALQEPPEVGPPPGLDVLERREVEEPKATWKSLYIAADASPEEVQDKINNLLGPQVQGKCLQCKTNMTEMGQKDKVCSVCMEKSSRFSCSVCDYHLCVKHHYKVTWNKPRYDDLPTNKKGQQCQKVTFFSHELAKAAHELLMLQYQEWEVMWFLPRKGKKL